MISRQSVTCTTLSMLLIACSTVSAARADETSRGTANAKVTVKAAQEWAIAGGPGTTVSLQDLSGSVRVGTFSVTNSTPSASLFYLVPPTPAGATEVRYFMASTTVDGVGYSFQVAPSSMTWDKTRKKFVSGSKLEPGSSSSVNFYPDHVRTSDLPPGVYVITAELFVPSV
ncbi:hypothetical protein ACSN7O_004847 [Enterobacter chuandaensis]